jgi:YD repeat-containing protein
MLHLDILPTVASVHLMPASTRVKTASLPPVPLKSRLASWLTAVLPWQRVQEIPPLASAPGLPPAWGASASVYGGVVNLGNGNLCLQVPIVGWANGVSFTLVFNSQANPSQPSPIAPKWTHSWNVFLEVSSDNKRATLQEGDGSRWVYRDDDLDGVFVPPTGVFDCLVRESDGRYVLTRKGSEERWEFGASGTPRRLERVVDRYGREIRLSYASGQLQAVVDRYGRALTLQYANNRLWKVSDFTGRTWELVYGGTGRLERVRFPAVEDEQEPPQVRVYEIGFGYNSRGNVTSWTDRLGRVWQYGYLSATSDALKWFQDPAGNRWVASYTSAQPVGALGGTPETGSTRWVDPTRVWVEYGFAGPTVVRHTQGGDTTTARLTTRLWYNGQYQVIKRQDPAGLVWEWNYDTQGNLLWSKEPNGARTDYTYYAGTDRVWKITDALGYVWEYTYTSYGDVKSVKDPEGGAVQYVYDYELGEPAYGQVRRVIDALGRATEYQYYAANDSNPARRGQVRRVEVPGGYWRAMDYGGAGWLVRREVQTANGSEVTTYTYDAWGRLRGIDYPRSADVSIGWDGENRRVWVQDGAGRREYSYDAWGRVVRQEGCCGNEAGIEVEPCPPSMMRLGGSDLRRSFARMGARFG